MTEPSNVRTEHDAFGPVEMPADRYWGGRTQRALGVFEIGEERFPTCLVRAFGLQKLAVGDPGTTAGRHHRGSGPRGVGGTLRRAFPAAGLADRLGPQTNMNANEVVANRANGILGQPLGTRRPIHPNDHVNRSQSSNDSFPTVMHLSAGRMPGRSHAPATCSKRSRA